MNRTRVATFVVAAVLAVSAVVAQPAPAPASKAVDDLRRGIQLFADARYSEAQPLFDALFFDPAAGDLRADGAYWSAMTLLASGNPAAAEKAMESFLVTFPGNGRTAELLYHKARASFLQKDYERAVRSFQAYLAAYPAGDFVPAAVFWSAESLYSLGRLPDAEKLYRTIGERYPDSVKAEAAKYRLSLIQFKYREDELLTLLKWSHEESLRIIEEFQRREKAYEQALEVYQKRYGDARRGVEQTQASLEDQVANLKLAMDDLAKRLQDKDTRVAELERQLSVSIGQPAGTPSATSAGTEATAGLDSPSERELLDMKRRALALMQFYLEKLAERSVSGGGK